MDVPIRLHVLLFLGIIGVFAIDWHYRSFAPALGTGLVTALVVIFSIVVHELAHVWACLNLGGVVHSVTLTPWGGNSHLDPPPKPWEKLLVHAAGPFANGALFAIGATMLTGSGHSTLSQLTNPFSPHAFSASEWEVSLVSILTWTSFQLFIFNLVPCYPLDGLRMLRDLFAATNPHASGLKIEATLMAIGQLVAASVVVMAVVLRNFNDGPVQPVWSLLLAAGVTMFFAARFEYRQRLREIFQAGDWDIDGESGESLTGIPFDQESSGGWFHEDQYSQWLNEKQAQVAHEESSLALDELEDEEVVTEEEMADEILDKLHRQGIGNLTQHERLFLEQFSRRLRDRRSEV